MRRQGGFDRTPAERRRFYIIGQDFGCQNTNESYMKSKQGGQLTQQFEIVIVDKLPKTNEAAANTGSGFLPVWKYLQSK